MSRTERGLLRMSPCAKGLHISLHTCEGEPILSMDLLLDEVAEVADGRTVAAHLHGRRWLCGPRELEVRTVREWMQVRGEANEYGRTALLRMRLEGKLGKEPPTFRSLLSGGTASAHVRLRLEFSQPDEVAA